MNEEIIKKNYLGLDESFIGRLHEDGFFDSIRFKELYDALNNLSGIYSEKKLFPAEIVAQACKIFAITLRYFICHFDNSDMYSIKNFQSFDYASILEKWQCLMENFGVRKLPDSIFDDF